MLLSSSSFYRRTLTSNEKRQRGSEKAVGHWRAVVPPVLAPFGAHAVPAVSNPPFLLATTAWEEDGGT